MEEGRPDRGAEPRALHHNDDDRRRALAAEETGAPPAVDLGRVEARAGRQHRAELGHALCHFFLARLDGGSRDRRGARLGGGEQRRGRAVRRFACGAIARMTVVNLSPDAGMPSGHATASACAGVFLAYVAVRAAAGHRTVATALRLLAAASVALVVIARVRLGCHTWAQLDGRWWGSPSVTGATGRGRDRPVARSVDGGAARPRRRARGRRARRRKRRARR
jgi:hypothetical protein